MVWSLLQFSERWPRHIWPVSVSRMEFASLEANFGGGWGLFVYHILLFSRPLTGRSRDISEILLTGTLDLNSFNPNMFLWSPVFMFFKLT